MHRRSFVAALTASALAGRAGAELAPGAGWRRFELTTEVELAQRDAPAQLWLPLTADDTRPYQRRLARRFETNGRA